MKYFAETWQRMAEKHLTAFDAQMSAFPHAFKPEKGERTIPLSAVRDLIRASYIQGAESALSMAEAIDAPEKAPSKKVKK